jgi:uncharacterized membrane protein YbaN (DUF454 family)
MPLSPIRRALWLALGWASLVLAVIGALLPVMPTTVFLLVAAAAFARSSPRMERMLLENRFTGPVILSWRESRSIPARARTVAITMVVLGCGTSAILVPVDIARWSLVAIAAALVFFLARLPTRAEPALA